MFENFPIEIAIKSLKVLLALLKSLHMNVL